MGKGKLRFLLPLIILLLATWLLYRMTKRPETVPYFGAHLEGFPIDEARLHSEFAAWPGKPDFIGFFEQWPAQATLFDGAKTLNTLVSIDKYGAVPVITWEPMIIEAGREIFIPATEIIDGQWDEYLKAYAEAVKQFGKPLIMRFAHEMNLIRYHWGSTPEEYRQSPEKYQEMFRYVRQKVMAVAGDKIAWMFCPNHQPLTALDPPKQEQWNRMRAWFPGKEHVDLLGIDGYNWGEPKPGEKPAWASSWQTPWDVFATPIEELRALSPETPLFIGETASIQRSGERTDWIRQLLQMADKRRISGVLWFQINKERSWQLKPEEALDFYYWREKNRRPDAAAWLQQLLAKRIAQASESSRAIE